MKKKIVTPENYRFARDAILNFLERTQAVSEGLAVAGNLCELSAKVAQKLLSESFNVVLVGEFQSGKSTTFNALCGRAISPMGDGCKTSACVLTARNLSDPRAKERAVVTWKTDKEILTCLSVFSDRLPPSERARFENGHFSLDESADIKLLADALKKEIEEYAAAPEKYSDDMVDLLYIGRILLTFLDHREIKALRKTPSLEVGLGEVGEYVAFPANWTERNGDDIKSGAVSFTAREIAFAFVARVDCYLHSSTLERTGCVVVDCPGLFAGPWDSEVAFKAICDSDAAFYLLPGDKQLGEQDVKAIRKFANLKLLRKLNFAINAQKSYESFSFKILPRDLSEIKKSFGFDISSQKVPIFHARLAYLADVLKREKTLTAEENELAYEDVTRFQGLSSRHDRDYIEQIVVNDSKLRKASRFDALLDCVDSLVVERKASSMLYDYGIEPVAEELDAVVESIQKRVGDIREALVHDEKELAEARRIYDDYFDCVRAMWESLYIPDDEFQTQIESDPLLLEDVSYYYKEVFSDTLLFATHILKGNHQNGAQFPYDDPIEPFDFDVHYLEKTGMQNGFLQSDPSYKKCNIISRIGVNFIDALKSIVKEKCELITVKIHETGKVRHLHRLLDDRYDCDWSVKFGNNSVLKIFDISISPIDSIEIDYKTIDFDKEVPSQEWIEEASNHCFQMMVLQRRWRNPSHYMLHRIAKNYNITVQLWNPLGERPFVLALRQSAFRRRSEIEIESKIRHELSEFFGDEEEVPYVSSTELLSKIIQHHHLFLDALAKEFSRHERKLSQTLVQAIYKAYANFILQRLLAEKKQFEKVLSEKSTAFQNDPRHKTVAELERLLQALAPLREACESLKKKIYQLCYSD